MWRRARRCLRAVRSAAFAQTRREDSRPRIRGVTPVRFVIVLVRRGCHVKAKIQIPPVLVLRRRARRPVRAGVIRRSVHQVNQWGPRVESREPRCRIGEVVNAVLLLIWPQGWMIEQQHWLLTLCIKLDRQPVLDQRSAPLATSMTAGASMTFTWLPLLMDENS